MLVRFESTHLNKGVTINNDGSDGIVVICGNNRGAWLNAETNELTVIVCLRGDIQLTTGNHTFILSKGCLWIEHGQQLRAASIGDAQWVAMCCIGKSYYRLLGNLIQPDFSNVSSLETCCSKVNEVCNAILSEVNTSECSERVSNAVIDYLASVITLNTERSYLSPGRNEKSKILAFQRLIKVRNKMAIEPSSIKTVAEMATLASYSEWHFIRVFHRVFGETPQDYSQRVRLGHAKHLLVSSRMSVSEIARTSGYETFPAFCRSFRNYFGLTASAMRNRAFSLHKSTEIDKYQSRDGELLSHFNG